MTSYLIGLDYGTGGAKACIIDDQANILAYAYREYPIYASHSGWSEHDPHLYWQTACEVIKECLETSKVRPDQIKGIANSSALPSLVMVDKDHHPINLAYNLMDRRATEQVQWLRDNIGENRLFEVSCNRLEDHPTLVNLMWEKQNRPDSFARIYKALTIDGYIRLKLTGKATANFSSGAFFGIAYDLRQNKFDEELLAKIGLDPKIMPDFFSCEEVVGSTTEAAAKETGLVRGHSGRGGFG